MGILIIAALLTLPTVSASKTEMSLEELVKEADIIAIGDIREVVGKWAPGRTTMYSYSTLSVNRYIKGVSGLKTLTIISEGGTQGSLFVRVEDSPIFMDDEQVLVFLKKSGDDFSVVGLDQGKYNLKNGILTGRSGAKTPLNEFLRQIDDTMTLLDIPKPDTPETPGFEIITGFIALLSMLYVLNLKNGSFRI